MSRVEKGRRVQLTYKEKGPTGRPTLIVDVSAEDDILPHEHRENTGNHGGRASERYQVALEWLSQTLQYR